MNDLSLEQQIAAFLAVCRTASLATVDQDGGPYAANVQYASDSAWRLYWVSSPNSAHSLHLSAKSDAAVTIYAHRDTPERIHGLQMRGFAQVLGGDDADRALSLYAEKYPFVADPPFNEAVRSQRFYRFTPNWLRWIDNRQGFGWKRELTL